MVEKGRTSKAERILKKSTYFGDSYFTEKQLFSLAAQINRIHQLNPSNILEIGKGNGFVSDFLRKAGYPVTTFDINPSLNPDVVGDVMDLEKHFAKKEFNLVTCSEVLEHIPFECFHHALSQIAIVSSQHVFLTLPRCRRVFLDFRLWLNVKGLPLIDTSMFLSTSKSRILAEHHWEIDCSRKTRKRKIIKILEQNFHIKSFKRFNLNPYHQFICLRHK